MTSRSSWDFADNDEIVPGRHVLRRLGGGTRFEVYLAVDDHLWSTVVVKLLRPDYVTDERALAALRNEVDVLGRLAHPIVVRSFGSTLDGPRPHIVLEHLEGPPLQRLLRRYGPLPAEQLVPLAVEMCSALHYLAAEGWVHLDVKPANIIMSSSPRLVDLSVARTVAAAARLSSPVGTAPYMAPEQCVPGKEFGPVGPPADIWGLGATLYRAMTGKRPFERGGDTTYPQLTEDPRPFPKKAPGRIAEIITHCLAKDPASRPTAAEVGMALEPAIAALPRRPVLGRRRRLS